MSGYCSPPAESPTKDVDDPERVGVHESNLASLLVVYQSVQCLSACLHPKCKEPECHVYLTVV